MLVDATWSFRPLQKGDTLRNPVASNFFAQEAIEDPAEALVRESIQNSLDARIRGQKVKVRFAIQEKSPGESTFLVSVFHGLQTHVRSKENGLEEKPDLTRSFRYLVVEDFGTKGLEGSPEQWSPDPLTKNDFYSFFRAEGHTDKGEEDRGRWGVGKTVFPRSSEANTFFGMTVRASDRKTLLMGRSILKSHKVGTQQFHPDGYFGQWNDGLALPIANKNEQDDFAKHFKLHRGSNPGLSVVVPFLQSDITFDSLMRAVLRDYFFAILSGDLEVSLEAAQGVLVLKADNLAQVASQSTAIVGQDLAGMIQLAVWSRAIPAGKQFTIPCPPASSGAQAWEDYEVNDELRARLRDAISCGEPLAVRLGIRVRRKHSADQTSHCDLFLWQRDSSEQGKPVFIREGIIVSNANGTRVRGILSIVSIDDKPLATFLGDSENVAHTEWSPDRANFQQRYTYAKATLKLVKRAVADLVKAVLAGREDRDPDLLKDFFSFEIPKELLAEENPATPTKKKENEKTSGGVPPIPQSPPRFRIARVDGGFTVRRGDPASTLPVGLIVRVAYDVRRGSALKAYDPADFLLDTADFSLDKRGLEIKGVRANRIDAKVMESDFALTVTGFDAWRDIFVSVDAVDGEEAS